MTQRFTYPVGEWASGGVVTDPDTDTTHTSYVANRYASVGWKAEKPPNEWDNYLYQITDAKIIWLLQQGIQQYDTGVSYPAGAITMDAGIFYKNISTSAALNKPPATTPLVWQPVMELDGETFATLLAVLTNKLNDHLAADNPHQDTIERLNGVQKEYTFTALDADTDPKTIKYHTKQMGKIHSETPKQVGTLPAITTGSENTFTGDVSFLTKVCFNAAKTSYVQLNQATARAEMVVGNSKLAVDTAGRVYYTSAGVEYLVVTVANFDEVQIKVNNLFALPQPLAVIDVRAGSLSQQGCSPLTLMTTVDAVWDSVKGLDLTASGTLTASGINFTGVGTTAYIIGYNAAGLQSEFFNSGLSEYNNLGRFLTVTSVSKFTYLQSIVIYPSLTAYQRTTLVKYVTA